MYHGARQYLPKPIDKDVLQAEVENALWDKRHKTKETLDIRVNIEAVDDLDEREVMAFKLSYMRTTDVEIAKILNIEPATVRVIISRACKKLEVNSRIEAFKILFEKT